MYILRNAKPNEANGVDRITPGRRQSGGNYLTSVRQFQDIQTRLDLIEIKLGGILLIMTRIFGEDKLEND